MHLNILIIMRFKRYTKILKSIKFVFLTGCLTDFTHHLYVQDYYRQ